MCSQRKEWMKKKRAMNTCGCKCQQELILGCVRMWFVFNTNFYSRQVKLLTTPLVFVDVLVNQILHRLSPSIPTIRQSQCLKEWRAKFQKHLLLEHPSPPLLPSTQVKGEVSVFVAWNLHRVTSLEEACILGTILILNH